MVDLIPMGTINRSVSENNAVKSSNKVKEAAQAERLGADQKLKVDEPRRRFKRRQGDRRVSARGARWTKFERRKSRDRRASELDGEEQFFSNGGKSKASARKGRIIDERA